MKTSIISLNDKSFPSLAEVAYSKCWFFFILIYDNEEEKDEDKDFSVPA